jgi:hypothetical protein
MLAPGPVATAAPAPRRPRASGGTTLVAGVATLLVALGVGVLIGHESNNNTKTVAASSPPVQVVTVGGGASTAGTASSTGSTSTSTGATKGGKFHAAKAKPVTAKTAAQASSASAKVLGGGSAKLPPPTVQPGQACSGSGCTGGKFTGNFFGGG